MSETNRGRVTELPEEGSKMANEPQKPEAGLSTEMLLKMLIDVQKQAAESNKELAASILESRKPYVDPRVLEQKRLALEERQAEIRRELRRRQLTKQQCPHIRENGTSNISWMEHSNNIVKGCLWRLLQRVRHSQPGRFEIAASEPKGHQVNGSCGTTRKQPSNRLKNCPPRKR